MKNKCESCRHGFNGNGYSPCGCGKSIPPVVPHPPIEWEPTEPSFEPWFFVIFICLLGLFLVLEVVKT